MVQYPKASAPMLVTLAGIVTLVRPVQVLESLRSDVGDAAGNCVTSADAARKLKEVLSAVVKQNAAHTAIKRVLGGNVHRGQRGAISESIRSNAGHAGGNRHAGQAGAVIESPNSDVGDAVGDREVGQAGTAPERIIPGAGDAFGDRHDAQLRAASERTQPMLATLPEIVMLVRPVQS